MKAASSAGLASLLLAIALSACGGGGSAVPSAAAPGGGNAPGNPSPSPSFSAQPGSGAPLSGPALAPNGGWGPPAVATSLLFPVQAGYDGSGYTVAIVADSWIDAVDLKPYLAYFRIPQTGRSIVGQPVDGGPVSSSDAMTSALVLETVAALAPGANIIVYEIPSLNTQTVTDAYNRILSDAAANVVVSPFGACEGSNNGWAVTEPVVAQGTALGVTFVAASGNSGAQCAEYPASGPHSIGVGGTETYPPVYSLTSVTAFNDNLGPNGSQESSGGGPSQIFFKPAFQQGLSGTASPQFRNVPDIAMPASGAAVYYGGNWLIFNGTQWSAAQFGAMLVDTYEFCGIRFEQGAGLPYQAFDLAGYGAFIDVYLGSNSFDGYLGYEAERGYDSTSGIGVPLGIPVAHALCPVAHSLSRRSV